MIFKKRFFNEFTANDHIIKENLLILYEDFGYMVIIFSTTVLPLRGLTLQNIVDV